MLIASLVINFGLVVLIWIIQLIIYPTFYQVETARFVRWHMWYTTRISFIVVPLMVSQVMAFGWLLIKNGPLPVLVAQTVLVCLVWALTFFVSVPCHNALSVKKDDLQIARLVSTNWLRTAAWSLVAVLDWNSIVGS